jgi:uncharacterized membrane protein (UPF0127 family)
MHCLIFSILIFSFLLQAEQIEIGGKILNVEIADTYESRAKGLMGRKKLADGEGMLFVYETEQPLTFWMKDTLIPLSIAFFNRQKEAVRILNMDPPEDDHLIRYKSSVPALYALEVPQGWFEKEGIQYGAKFSFLNSVNEIH